MGKKICQHFIDLQIIIKILFTDIESPEIISQKPTDQTTLSEKSKEKPPPKIDEPLMNKTTELEGLDMSNLPKVEETKIENSNLTKNEEKKVGISSQNINNILIGRINFILKIN